jgi:HEAT repeat protein
MIVIDKLASSLGQRDEQPNIALAKEIAATNDTAAVKELVDLLDHKKKNIRFDAIKALYEAGEIKPELLAPYLSKFIDLLGTKDNRMQWGAMSAISAIAPLGADEIYEALPLIIKTADQGSVITRDKYVLILSKLGTVKQYNEEVYTLLEEQVLKAPINQLPMYAEKTTEILTPTTRDRFVAAVKSRMEDVEQESKLKRLEKVLKKAMKQ